MENSRLMAGLSLQQGLQLKVVVINRKVFGPPRIWLRYAHAALSINGATAPP
jgi:hypothetical protein